MSLISTHQKLTDLINLELNQLSLPAEPALIYDPIRYTLSHGGKRVRPYFVLTSCGMWGGRVEEAVPAGLAIELLHNFTLLHDDIMDMAEIRRGEPSVFKKWDSSTAILSGDVMYAWAFQQLQYYGRSDLYSKEQYSSILDLFLEGAERVCEGQAYDLEFSERADVAIEDYLKMILGKTATLISISFMLGAAIAGVNEERLQIMKELGRSVGTAFQIQDDLLDVVADTSKFGKNRGGDIAEGKKTYLSILALEEGNEEQKSHLKSIFEAKNVSEEDIESVIDIYRELGILEKTGQIIDSFYSEADTLLEKLPESGYKDNLIVFLNKLRKREF